MDRTGDLAERSLRALLPKKAYLEYRVCAAWDEAVGERIAQMTRPVRVKDGLLTVAANDSAWVTELGYMSEDLRDKVNEALGGEEVRHIRFVVKPRTDEGGD